MKDRLKWFIFECKIRKEYGFYHILAGQQIYKDVEKRNLGRIRRLRKAGEEPDHPAVRRRLKRSWFLDTAWDQWHSHTGCSPTGYHLAQYRQHIWVSMNRKKALKRGITKCLEVV